jgi:hypothetical protein
MSSAAVGAADIFTTALDGAAPERDVARDLVRRALPLAPVLIAVGGLGWGVAGALSVAFAVLLVTANFAAAAMSLGWAARVNLALLMGVALFGYLVRLGLMFVAVWSVRGAWWYEPLPLGLALIFTHLGLLLWELRFVSVSLAHPGLKPTPATKEKGSR